MNKKFSPLANGIIQGLMEAIQDANNETVAGMKKSTVYKVQPKKVREQISTSKNNFGVSNEVQQALSK